MFTYKRRLSIPLLTGKGDNDLFRYLPPVKDYILTESVRGGLEAILRLIKAEENSKVLMPAFIAEGIVRPFRNNNIKILFYRLDEELNPDISDIENQIAANPGIRYLVAIHYFGFPYDFAYIKGKCNNHNIYLLEDCVHALFSRDKSGDYLGKTGDISFFSLPKILPVPDGAIFFINNPGLLAIRSGIKYRKSIAGLLSVNLHLLYLLLKRAEVKLSYLYTYKVLNAFSKALYGLYYALLNRCIKPQPVSKVTMNILRNINYNELIEKRNSNARLISNAIMQNGRYKLFRECDHNVVLTGVPVISDKTSQLVSILKKNSIECLRYRERWLFIPKDNTNRFGYEFYFYDHHFLLPVHEEDGNYIELLNDL